MIFGTVGAHTQGFDRLIRALDQWAGSTTERVVIQTGNSRYEPQQAEWFRFASPDRIESLFRDARVVVTHAGSGSLIKALECGRSVLAVPRLASLSEHFDDHQIELCEALERGGSIRTVSVISDLDRLLSLEPEPATWSPANRAQLTTAISAAVTALTGTRDQSGPHT